MRKLILDLGPLLAFWYGYKTAGLLYGSIYMAVVSLVAMLIAYILDKKINYINLISILLLITSASLTFFSGNMMFIKMKPTILYLIFSGIFLITNFKWTPAIKFILDKAITFQDENQWRILNVRFCYFFVAMAICNEIIWRNVSNDTWVNFKVFGAMPITLLFMLSQMPFIIKHNINNRDPVD